MGLKNTMEKLTYVSTLHGFFKINVNSDTKGAVKRTNKSGKTVNELYFDTLDGYLKAVNLKDTDFGRQWEIDIEDDGEVFRLSLGVSDLNAYTLLFRFPNVQLDRKFDIRIMPDKESEGSVLWVRQYDQNIPRFFDPRKDQDCPHGCPGLDEIEINGKPTLDKSKQIKFLAEYYKDINEQIGSIERNKPMKSKDPVNGHQPPQVVDQQNDDDLNIELDALAAMDEKAPEETQKVQDIANQEDDLPF